MNIGLLVVLTIILLLPLLIKGVEDNIEIFLFIMGIIAAVISNVIKADFILEIFKNNFLYMITGAVLIGGFLFKYADKHIEKVVGRILNHITLKVFVFNMVIVIGLVSSIITAIISALFLVEIIKILPISRKNKIRINIISCFSIGLGSILTPIGEPLSTIISTKLNLDFWYMVTHLGIYIIPAVIMLGVLGAYYADKNENTLGYVKLGIEEQSNLDIIWKAVKVFIFIIALDMLGAGFRPLVDTYVVHLEGNLLYWINISSAVLDNATLAAAEISSKMSIRQINAMTLGLLISGGMMIPGNIPNIISSSKLKIKSSEWMKFGIPLGLIIMITFYIVLFVVPILKY